MGSPYAGNPAVYATDFIIPDDADPPTASAFTNAIAAALAGFMKQHPAVIAAIATFITTAFTAATAWLAAKGH
jgi:hypothetical protein